MTTEREEKYLKGSRGDNSLVHTFPCHPLLPPINPFFERRLSVVRHRRMRLTPTQVVAVKELKRQLQTAAPSHQATCSICFPSPLDNMLDSLVLYN